MTVIKVMMATTFRGVLNTPHPQINVELMARIWASLGLNFATFSIFYCIISLFKVNYAFSWLLTVWIWGWKNDSIRPCLHADLRKALLVMLWCVATGNNFNPSFRNERGRKSQALITQCPYRKLMTLCTHCVLQLFCWFQVPACGSCLLLCHGSTSPRISAGIIRDHITYYVSQ